MCRWFAYVSPTEPAVLEDLLIDPANSLSHQVHDHYLPQLLPHDPHTINPKEEKLVAARNSLYNLDGFGVAWFTPTQADFHSTLQGSRPALYKTTSPPINDFNIRSLAANTASKAVFAHIRASSGSVVQQVNCHPFTFGRHVFMHNGAVASFTDIRRELCDLMEENAFGNISGGTDSEHLAATYVTLLAGSDGNQAQGQETWQRTYSVDAMANALVATVQRVLELQAKLIKSEDRRPNSLNLAATDGHKMVALRFRNCKGEEPPSLYASTTAGVTLNRKYPGHPNNNPKSSEKHAKIDYKGHKKAEEHGKHLIVSSEPTTFDDNEWTLIPKNTLVLADDEGDLSTRTMQYDAGIYDAEDPDA